jgi:hypothetical protein
MMVSSIEGNGSVANVLQQQRQQVESQQEQQRANEQQEANRQALERTRTEQSNSQKNDPDSRKGRSVDISA